MTFTRSYHISDADSCLARYDIGQHWFGSVEENTTMVNNIRNTENVALHFEIHMGSLRRELSKAGKELRTCCRQAWQAWHREKGGVSRLMTRSKLWGVKCQSLACYCKLVT